jgi:NAD-dependent deacetylase
MPNLFVLTGAGISAKSGIPVFQGTSWRGRSHYALASIDAWHADPQLVWGYYSERRQRARDAKPNPAHMALAEYERAAAGRLFLCTQNVDGLHEAAGSRDAVHIHGKLFESRCSSGCGQPVFEDLNSSEKNHLPRCSCGALLRPNVCWFGERPFALDRVFHSWSCAITFSRLVLPDRSNRVASFVVHAKQRSSDVKTIYAGPAEPANAVLFDEILLAPASVAVPQILAKLRSSEGPA